MSRSYINHLNEKIETLYITLSTLQQSSNNSNSSNTTSTNTYNNVEKLIKIIRDIEKYNSTHIKYLEKQSSHINPNQSPSTINDDINHNIHPSIMNEYALVNEVLSDCYKKCATFIRSPFTEQLRNLISSSRKKLQMKASQGRN